MKRKAVFIDRDGTLVKNQGYICSYQDVEFYDFTVQALKIINSNPDMKIENSYWQSISYSTSDRNYLK